MNTSIDKTLAELKARRAELKWMQLRTAQLPANLQEELQQTEVYIAAARPGFSGNAGALQGGIL